MRTLLALSLLLACTTKDEGEIEQSCKTADDCDRGLICEELTALGYWGGLDTDDPAARICTQACQKDADCPMVKEADCEAVHSTCEEGYCRKLTICEG